MIAIISPRCKLLKVGMLSHSVITDNNASHVSTKSDFWGC